MGMEPRGGQADGGVAHFDGVPGGYFSAFHDADGEAGEVQLAGGVERGHLGGLAAEEGEAAVEAGVGDTLDKRSGHGGVVPVKRRGSRERTRARRASAL